jgi:hypothetical protein
MMHVRKNRSVKFNTFVFSSSFRKNKQQHKMNEFSGLTLVETSHFEIKIVFYWYILVGRRRRFYV